MDIIKLEYDHCIDINPKDYGIIYLGKKLEAEEVYEAIEDLTGNSRDDMIKNLMKDDLDYNTKIFKDHLLNYGHDVKNYTDILEMMEDGWGGEVEDYFIYNTNNIYNQLLGLAECNNLQVGKIGYSPWSWYVSLKGIKKSFIYDLWEGYNWYSISYIKNNDIIDVLGGCYIPNKNDLKEIIKDYFNIDKFYIVNNDIGQYFDHPKIEEIKSITYEYKTI